MQLTMDNDSEQPPQTEQDTASKPADKEHKGPNRLWWLQLSFIATCTISGLMKTMTQEDHLSPHLPLLARCSFTMLRLIGICELAGGLAMSAPMLRGVRKFGKPVIAGVLVTLQFIGIILHTQQGKYGAIPINVLLILLGLWIIRMSRSVVQ